MQEDGVPRRREEEGVREERCTQGCTREDTSAQRYLSSPLRLPGAHCAAVSLSPKGSREPIAQRYLLSSLRAPREPIKDSSDRHAGFGAGMCTVYPGCREGGVYPGCREGGVYPGSGGRPRARWSWAGRLWSWPAGRPGPLALACSRRPRSNGSEPGAQAPALASEIRAI